MPKGYPKNGIKNGFKPLLSNEEKDFLIQNYLKLSNEEIAQNLNLSIKQIEHQCYKLKLTRHKRWEKNEEIMLKEKVKNGFSIPELIKLFNRSEHSIRNKTVKLGIDVKHSEGSKRLWKDKPFRTSQSENLKNLNKNSDFLRNRLSSAGKWIIKNKGESHLEKILANINPSFKYVGDGRITLNGLRPDFINEPEKKIVEYFGNYWHKPSDEEERIQKFKTLGFDTLVVWEKEMKDNEKQVYNKIRTFCSEGVRTDGEFLSS